MEKATYVTDPSPKGFTVGRRESRNYIYLMGGGLNSVECSMRSDAIIGKQLLAQHMSVRIT